jgi:hypothetical protein
MTTSSGSVARYARPTPRGVPDQSASDNLRPFAGRVKKCEAPVVPGDARSLGRLAHDPTDGNIGQRIDATSARERMAGDFLKCCANLATDEM